MSEPTVYVVNESAHDFSAAEKFGKIVFITSGHVNPFNVNKMMRSTDIALQDALPEDLILITSLTILCSVVCAAFAVKFGHLNLLLFKDGGYIKRTIMYKR